MIIESYSYEILNFIGAGMKVVNLLIGVLISSIFLVGCGDDDKAGKGSGEVSSSDINLEASVESLDLMELVLLKTHECKYRVDEGFRGTVRIDYKANFSCEVDASTDTESLLADLENYDKEFFSLLENKDLKGNQLRLLQSKREAFVDGKSAALVKLRKDIKEPLNKILRELRGLGCNVRISGMGWGCTNAKQSNDHHSREMAVIRYKQEAHAYRKHLVAMGKSESDLDATLLELDKIEGFNSLDAETIDERLRLQIEEFSENFEGKTINCDHYDKYSCLNAAGAITKYYMSKSNRKNELMEKEFSEIRITNIFFRAYSEHVNVDRDASISEIVKHIAEQKNKETKE